VWIFGLMFSYRFSLHLNNLDAILEGFLKQLMCLITQFFETNSKNFKHENDNDIFQYFPNSKEKTLMKNTGIYDKLRIQNPEPSGSELWWKNLILNSKRTREATYVKRNIEMRSRNTVVCNSNKYSIFCVCVCVCVCVRERERP